MILTPIFYTIQIRTEKQLNSRQAFCPNTGCPASGHCGKGNIRIHSRTDKRYLCTPCHKTFSATTGTPFYRLRQERDLFVMVVTLLGYGCPVQAIVAACHLHERAVAAWQTRAAAQAKQVHEHLVEHPKDLGEAQADELRVKLQGPSVWVATAIWTSARLFLGGEVSLRRDRWLITRLIKRVRRSALEKPLLLVTDGLSTYKRAISRVFREPVARLGRGRRRLQARRDLCYAQVIKRREQRCVVAVGRRIVQGAATLKDC